MEDFTIPSLYSRIRKCIIKKPCKLLGATKNLTISTNTYTNFYKSTIEILHKKTFKVPEETRYPLLRESQKEYISIRTRLNTYSCKDKKNKPRIILPLTTKKRNQNYSSEKKNKKIKKNANFFICDGHYFGKREKHLLNIKTEKNILFKKFHPTDFYNSINYFKYAEPVEEIKNPEERIKDFFLLLNSIFRQDNHLCLKYKEKEIFGHKEEYYNYINDEFKKIYKKEKEINLKYFFNNSTKTRGYGKLDLYLKSARFDIIDENIKNNNIIKSINIPFDLMSMIYLCNIKEITHLIFFILNKIDLNDENIILSDEYIKILFSEVITKFQINEKRSKGFKLDLKRKNFENYTVKIFYLKSLENFCDQSKYSDILSYFSKNENNIKIIGNKGYKVGKNILNQKKIIFFNNFDYYKLLLIYKGKEYKIKFCMPEISLIFKDYEKQLNHCMDKELFLYLYQNNFVDWDFFILHYLYYLHDFRKYISKNLSLWNNFNLFLRKKIIDRNNNIEFNDSSKNNIIEDKKSILPVLNNAYYQYYLNNFYTSKININDDDYKFIFTLFNGNNLIKFKFKSYILYAFINNINKPEIYRFKFNFKQMKVLYYRSKFENFKLFLKRIILVKGKVINLDYSYFDSFNSMTNEKIYEFFYKLDQNNKEIPQKEEIKLNSLVLKMREPHFEIMLHDKTKVNNFKVKHYRIELNSKFLSLLINNDVNDWMKIIVDNQDFFNENKFKKYEEYTFRLSRKKSTIIK